MKKASSLGNGGEERKSVSRKRRKLLGLLSVLSNNEKMNPVVQRMRSMDANASDCPDFVAIVDRFETLEEVSAAIRKEGVDQCGLIFGIDYTLSNMMQGEKTFNSLSLHSLEHLNPYQQVICILGETLEDLIEDGKIPVFGFGDAKTKNKSIFPLKMEEECQGFSEVLATYNEVTPTVKLGGPTNFAPLIYEAIDIVKRRRKYHILVITADGQVTNEEETTDAIVEASNYPLSIVVVGVGDGPWEVMVDYDDNLPKRRFDNFQFVNFHEVMTTSRNPHTAFALAALMEIPDQFKAIKRLKLLESLAPSKKKS